MRRVLIHAELSLGSALLPPLVYRVNDQPFTAAAVTPSDIRDYRGYLVHDERRAPATVNRRLAALRKFFAWAKAQQLIQEEPTLTVKGIDSAPRSPEALEKRELDRLVRPVEHHGGKRDQAILLALRHTGLRVSELCALRLGDLTINDRSGQLVVRAGQQVRYRAAQSRCAASDHGLSGHATGGDG